MGELEFKVTNIKIITKDEIEISISVWDGNEVSTILENLSEENDPVAKVMRVGNYSFTIRPISYEMTHCKDCELEDCFEVYSEHEHAANLNPKLRRQWHTANIVDTLTDYFFKHGYFNKPIYDHLTVDHKEME